MRIAGQWVGWGLGDTNPKLTVFKRVLKNKFQWVRDWQPALDDSPTYDATLTDVVAEMQRRYGLPATGILNYATQLKCGFAKSPEVAKPVVFTVEGHMSSMWLGPCAETARALENERLIRWQPVGYNNTALPFDNKSGEDELCRLLADTKLLPAGTPWAMCVFSQGAIVGSRVWMKHIAPPSGKLHWRLPSWRGTLAFGSPYRERDVVAPWVPDPPRRGTQGISNERMTGTPQHWMEVARTGDLYTENDGDGSDASEHKTAIYLAVQNKWTGDPDSLFNQLLEIWQRPAPEMLAAIQAISSGAMFVANMNPHGGYDLAPCIAWLRSRLTAFR